MTVPPPPPGPYPSGSTAGPYPPGTAGSYPPPAQPGPGTASSYPPPPQPEVPPGPERDVGETSLGELIGNVSRDLSTLMRQELALAQAELRQEASKTGKAAGALGGAGLAAYFAVLFLSLALWAGLSHLMDAGWAGLLVALLWGIAAAVLYTTGRTKLREVRPTPERTVDTLSSVPDALRGHRGGTTP